MWWMGEVVEEVASDLLSPAMVGGENREGSWLWAKGAIEREESSIRWDWPSFAFFLLDRKWVHHLILDWESQLGSQVTNRWNPYRLDWPFPKPTQPVSRADLTKKETALMPLMVGVAILIWLGGASGSAGLNWPMACQLHVAQACDIQWIFSFLEKHVSDKTSWHPCFRVCSAVVVSTFH